MWVFIGFAVAYAAVCTACFIAGIREQNQLKRENARCACWTGSGVTYRLGGFDSFIGYRHWINRWENP